MHAGKRGNFGKVHIQGEEVADNKFDIFLQLAASNLDKKDFFGKVCNVHTISYGLHWYPCTFKIFPSSFSLFSLFLPSLSPIPLYFHHMRSLTPTLR